MTAFGPGYPARDSFFRSGSGPATPDELQDRLRVPDATDRRTAAHLKPSESEAAGSLRGELFFGFMYPVSFIFMTSCALYIR